MLSKGFVEYYILLRTISHFPRCRISDGSCHFHHIFICWFPLLFWTVAFRASTNKLSVHYWQRPNCPANEHSDVRGPATNGEWVAAESGPNPMSAKASSTPARPAEAWNLPDSSREPSLVGWIPVQCYWSAIMDLGSYYSMSNEDGVLVMWNNKVEAQSMLTCSFREAIS